MPFSCYYSHPPPPHLRLRLLMMMMVILWIQLFLLLLLLLLLLQSGADGGARKLFEKYKLYYKHTVSLPNPIATGIVSI